VLPFAAVVEGAPPALDAAAIAGFAYVSLVATALAYLAWFAGMRRLGPAVVGLVGLLNPVTGVALGALVAGEALTSRQLVGLAIVLVGIGVGQVTRGTTAARGGRTGGAPRPTDHPDQSASASRKPRVGTKNVVPVTAVEKSRMRS